MAIVGKDYRGLRLCEPCWNGVHWVKGKYDKRPISHCESGHCQCPCTKMPPDRSGINRKARESQAKSKQAQISVPDPGAGYSHVNPQDRRRDG